MDRAQRIATCVLAFLLCVLLPQSRSISADVGEGVVGAGAAVAPLAVSEGCTLCEGAHAFPCHRCEGEGQSAVPCKRCGGSRRIECPVRVCEKGRLTCFACDGSGRITWKGGETDPCKVCAKKGSHTCPFCKAGRIDCPDCKRSGKQVVRCVACLGLGAHPCPKCEPDSCALCGDRRSAQCGHCRGDGAILERCEECYDYELVFCSLKSCVAGNLICSQCYGSGVARMVFGDGTAAGSSKCDKCKGRGYERCKNCKKGVIACEEERPQQPCEHCSAGRRPCPACN